MKFALNGAITIGTLDGANIEIMEEVGKENIFIFGLDADGVAEKKKAGYDPEYFYYKNLELKRVISQIQQGYFSKDEPDRFKPIVDALLHNGDQYMLFADYEDYVACQKRVSETFRDRDRWARMSILNTANMGKFSTDRTIQEYAKDIWKIKRSR